MICYVGKATKIFIFIVAVVAITGLVVGLGIFRRNIHPKSDKCSGEECEVSDYSPPPPLQMPFPSLPDSTPSDPTAGSNANPPPPDTSLSPPVPPETSLSPPAPPATSLPQPPPPETSLPPPLDNPSPPPPIPVSVVTPPAAVTTAPPPAVEVAPGPMNSS